MAAIIEVENLVKRYGGFTAVQGISFQVQEGEIFGLLGPNGAGKTTTLEIMETLRPKTSGRVLVDGLDVDKDAYEIKKRIGVQLQAAGYYPNLSLRQLVDLFNGLYNQNADAGALLARVGLTDKMASRFKTLSGGQKQRFSIATTLINKPRIVFLDEPTTGLDPQARRNLWDLIRSIRQEGVTVVITTHYMDEAEQLCDRVAVMDGGRIIVLDSPENMINTLVQGGFAPQRKVLQASLEDVFLHLTGREYRED